MSKDTEKSNKKNLDEVEGKLKKPPTPENAESENDSGAAKGVKAILDRALQSYEKLPMLEIVFDRLVRLVTASLRNLTTENIDVSLVSYNSMRFADFIKGTEVPTLMGIFKVVEWEKFGLLIVDKSLSYLVIDLLFGGRNTSTNENQEAKGYTEIEQAIVRHLSEIILNDMSGAFSPISPANFQFERSETNPNFISIARPGEGIILLKIKLSFGEKGDGVIDVAIPYSTLDPIKPLLSQVFIGETFGTDPEWEEAMKIHANDFEMQLDAIINDKPSSIEKLASLKVGNTIIIEHKKDDPISLQTGGVEIFNGGLGKVENKLAISIEKTLIKKKQELNMD